MYISKYKKKVFNEILMISKFKNDFTRYTWLLLWCWCGKNFSGIIIFNTLLPLFSKEQSRECISIEKWNWATSKCSKKCWKLHCLVARFFCVCCVVYSMLCWCLHLSEASCWSFFRNQNFVLDEIMKWPLRLIMGLARNHVSLLDYAN